MRLPATRTRSIAARPQFAPAQSALAGFLSENTKRAYNTDILQFLGASDLSQVTMEDLLSRGPEDAIAFRDSLLAKGRSASTVARKMSAIRTLYRYLVARGLLTLNPCDPRLVRSPKRPRLLQTDYLEWKDAIRFLSQPDRSCELGKRDYAMLMLALKVGLRRAELCGLKDDDILRNSRATMLRIHGKGGKDRLVPVPKDAYKALETWLTVRPSCASWVFVTMSGKRLTENAFWRRVKAYAESAHLTGVHPHTLRATCIEYLLRRGVPLHEVQQIMGHSRGDTTLNYVRRLDLSKSKALTALEGLSADPG